MSVDTSTSSPRLDAGMSRDTRHAVALVLTTYADGAQVVLDNDLIAPARAQVSALVSQLLPPLDQVVRRGSLLQAHRNAQARVELVQEFDALTSAQVARRAHSVAKNPSATTTRWASQGKIFNVSWDGAAVYLGFQFDDEGQPLPVVAEVLATVGDRLAGWELALWFTGDSSWLDDDRPVDVLRTAPADVVEAARYAVADLPE